MTSETGSNKGFTLVEVLLAVSILSIGIVGVLRGYATSINALGIAQESANAVCLLKEKMLEIEQIALEQKGIETGRSSGEFKNGQEGYSWTLESKPAAIADLNEVIITVSHKESPRKFSLVTYVESVK